MFLLGVATPCAAFTPSPAVHAATHAAGIRSASRLRMDLTPFLEKAGVSPKFVAKVVKILDAEMIGDEDGLRTANELGLLRKLLKPAVAVSIERALGVGSPDVSA